MTQTLHQVLVSPLIGGAATVALRLTSAARARSLSCIAWVPGNGPASAALSSSQIPWRTYGLDAMQRGRLRQLTACARMFTGLRNGARPIVHVHNPIVYRLLYPALLAARARTVVHVHMEQASADIEWAFRFPPDHVVACAQFIASQIARTMSSRAPAMQITAVANAIDVARLAAIRDGSEPQHDSSPRRHVILMLANLTPNKGQATALRATSRLRQRGINVECWLAGEDRTGTGYERELRLLASTLGIDAHVRFLGFRPDTDELLRAADVLLLPSTQEGLPLTILEAQAAGVPVVTSPLPGILEVVRDGVTGFVAPPDDDEGYATAVQRLLDGGELRASIVSAAREHVAREHAWDTFERRIFDVYESVGQITKNSQTTRRES